MLGWWQAGLFDMQHGIDRSSCESVPSLVMCLRSCWEILLISCCLNRAMRPRTHNRREILEMLSFSDRENNIRNVYVNIVYAIIIIIIIGSIMDKPFTLSLSFNTKLVEKYIKI